MEDRPELGVVLLHRRPDAIQTFEAIIDADGRVKLLSEVSFNGSRRALVTVPDEPAVVPGEVALLSEKALAADWLRPEEDQAWSYL